MALQFRALATLAEDQGLIPGTHMAAHTIPKSSSERSGTLSGLGW